MKDELYFFNELEDDFLEANIKGEKGLSPIAPISPAEGQELIKGDFFSYLISSSESGTKQFGTSEKRTSRSAEVDLDLEEKLAYIRQALLVGGFSELGDLNSTAQREIKKTVDCVYSLVRQRQVDVEFRKKHDDTMQRYKNEMMVATKKYELLKRENGQLKRELGKNELELNNIKDQLKASTIEIKNTKEECQQALNKMEQKVTQMVHEVRKNSISLTKMQDLYKKNNKSYLPYKNSIEITNRLSNEEYETMYKHIKRCDNTSIHNLGNLMKEGYDRSHTKLIEENTKLKECLKIVNSETLTMLNQLIEKLRTKFTEKEMRCIESISIKPMIFEVTAPGILNDLCILMKENISRIKDAHDIVINLSS